MARFWETWELKDDGSPVHPIRLGASACLLGERVRFDGGHKQNKFMLQDLKPYVEWVPVCPEVEMGMSIPRETIRLVGEIEDPELIGPKTETNYTKTMKDWSAERLPGLVNENLHGFVLKKDSPSCGLFRVRVYNEKGMPTRAGRGLFARALVDDMPLLPVEEEGRLRDPYLRENFIMRVFTLYRWSRLMASHPTTHELVSFHASLRMLLMAHHPAKAKEMGRWVSQAGSLSLDEFTTEYHRMMMECLASRPNRGRQCHVLSRLMGFLKQVLSSDEKQELSEVIQDFRQGMVPLLVPITLLRSYFRRHTVPDWIHEQVYLNPYPKELMLRTVL